MRLWGGAHTENSVDVPALSDRVSPSGPDPGTSQSEGGMQCLEEGLRLDAPWRPKRLWQKGCA